MSTIKGTVKKEELSGGIWVLDADDGERYQLQGGDGTLLKDGQKATVEGSVDKNAMGIGMVGSIFKVKSYQLG